MMATKPKPKAPQETGPGPLCSERTAAAIAALSDIELLCGCPYPCGSPAKVEWLRLRNERFAAPIVQTYRLKNIDRQALDSENDHMADVLWNPMDNPAMSLRTAGKSTLTEPREILHWFGTHTNESE